MLTKKCAVFILFLFKTFLYCLIDTKSQNLDFSVFNLTPNS